jgi:RNAse (barnase) inhibitor barstar
MAYFSDIANYWQRLDWQILRDGGIALYWRNEYLAQDAQWLKEHDYHVYDFDCATWLSSEDMFADFGRVLQFPDWWGRNLNALNDCITDLPLEESRGAVLVLQHFDSYASQSAARELPKDDTEAVLLLDILADASRFYLVNGIRVIALVQTDDPKLQIRRLGGKSPRWNEREWLNTNRR